jgi:hypothetical protein
MHDEGFEVGIVGPEQVADLGAGRPPVYEQGLEGLVKGGVRRGLAWKRWLMARERISPLQGMHPPVLAGKEAS